MFLNLNIIFINIFFVSGDDSDPSWGACFVNIIVILWVFLIFSYSCLVLSRSEKSDMKYVQGVPTTIPCNYLQSYFMEMTASYTARERDIHIYYPSQYVPDYNYYSLMVMNR